MDVGNYTQGQRPSLAQLRQLLEQFSQHLREDPDDLLVRLKLAEVLRLLERPEEALKLYSSVAWAYAIEGNLVQAIMLCKVILELAPEHRETQEMLAKLYASHEVRERKHSVPVEQRDGRWVVDPTNSAAGSEAKGRLPDALPATQAPPAVLTRRTGEEAASAGGRIDPTSGGRGPFSPGGGDLIPDPPSEADAATSDDSFLRQQPTAVGRRRGLPPLPPEDDEDEVNREPTQVGPEEKDPGSADQALRQHQTSPGYAAVESSLPDALSETPKPGGDDDQSAEAAGGAPIVEIGTEPAKRRVDTWTLSPVDGSERPPRSTKPMPGASMSTMLRRDAEIAFHDQQSSPTECHEALRREVRQEGRQLEDVAPAAETQQQVERDLRDTIQEFGDRVKDGVGDRQLPVWPLFSALETKAFISVVNRLERRIFAAGSTVLREGDPGESLLLVSAGHLQVFKTGDAGDDVELARLGPGAFFGEFALLADQRRHASVRCLDDCELLELRREVLAELVREHPSVGTTLQVFYEQRVLEMVLATSPLFLAVTPEERMIVAERFERRRFGPGELIVEQGGESSFHVVLLGEVTVSCATDDGGRQVELGVLNEGDYFGEMSLLSGEPAEATVRAARATEALTLRAQDFYDLASLHPEIWAEVQRECKARQDLNRQLLAASKASALLL